MLAAWKVSKYGVISGPYFPVFGLNTERYSVSLCIQSEYGKMQARKTPNTDNFCEIGNAPDTTSGCQMMSFSHVEKDLYSNENLNLNLE